MVKRYNIIKLRVKNAWSVLRGRNVAMSLKEIEDIIQKTYNAGHNAALDIKPAPLEFKVTPVSDMEAKALKYLGVLDTMPTSRHLEGIIRTYLWDKQWSLEKYEKEHGDGKPDWQDTWDFKNEQWRKLVNDENDWLAYIAYNDLKVEHFKFTVDGAIPATMSISGSEYIKSRVAEILKNTDRTLVKNISWHVVFTSDTGVRTIETVSLTKYKAKKAKKQ